MRSEQNEIEDPFSKKEENYLRKELYDLIQDNHVIFDFLQDDITDGLWFWDLENPENEWTNNKFWDVLGYDQDDIPKKHDSWKNTIFKEDLKKFYKNFTEHFKKPLKPFDQIIRAKHKLGHTIWIQCRGIILRDQKGKPKRMLGVHNDITLLKKAEEGLKEQIKSFQHIVDGTDLGTWQLNVKTGVSVFNERWANIIGYTLEDMPPITLANWPDYLHPDDLEQSNQSLKDHLEGKTEIYESEFRMKHKDGSYVWILDKGKLVNRDVDGNPELMIGSHQEITEKKRDYERNRLFIEQAPSAIAMFDINMCYLAISQKWYEVYEIDSVDIIGKSYYEVFDKEEKEIKNIHQRSLAGKVIKNHERKIEKPNGEVQWLLCEYRPWYSDKNKTEGIIIHTSDITKVKKEEELQALLEVTKDQNKRLKNFAHIVSHNLKSHSGNFEMLLDIYLQENPKAKNNEIIQLFKKASQNLSDTILHLNEVVQINTSIKDSLKSINLGQVIDKVIRTVAALAIESKVIIENKVEYNHKVLAIPAYLDSIILNFITNGIKYRSNDRDSYVTLSAARNNEHIVLSIKDNGLGIDLKKHRFKLFGMYKTFHSNVSNSRGIGLFIAKNQIEAIGGDVEVESEVNYGTTFKIYFRYEKS
ncbi:PAS domain-containing protein [Aquimarina sp. 2201CG1-2-11]|uniref:PAS domain-containing protein n=1 Tax=Aquimarina discodermiae TaxID=3231043 RepID=UPI003461D830